MDFASAATPRSGSSRQAVAAERARAARTIIHECQKCGRRFDHGYTPRCPSCTGMVEVFHDLGSAEIHESPITSQRFADLLPVRDRANLLYLGEGGTPCVHLKRLGAELGLENLYAKIESLNPTGTTKDRMAAVVLSLFKELGVKEFTSSSTGNSSSSLARGIRMHPQFTMHLYVGGDFSDRVRYADDNPGVQVNVLPDASFTDAFNRARSEAQSRSLPFEGGFFNPARREGLKLAFFEAVEQIRTPIRWYFQAVSSAMGVQGTWKGAKELLALGLISELPRLVCVQQESCCPMVKAFQEDSPELKEHHVFHNPTGIAKAILRGNSSASYPYVYSIVRESGGTMVSVSEAEILDARQRLKRLDDVDSGYCGSATVAAVAALSARQAIPSGDAVLLNLTD